MITMNMQAMMQQAQKLQRDMMKAKNEIDEKKFTSTQGFLTIEMKGNWKNKEVQLFLYYCSCTNTKRCCKKDG